MVEQKDDAGRAGRFAQTKRAAQSPGATEGAPGEFAAGPAAGDNLKPAAGAAAAGLEDKPIGTDKPHESIMRRKQRYLIGFRSLAGFASVPADPFLDKLKAMDGVEIIRRLRPRHSRSASPANESAIDEIVVARMDEQRGEALRQHAPPHIIVEIDARLGYSDMAIPAPASWQPGARAMPLPQRRRDIRVRILGRGDRPLADASVNLYGPGFPVQAITDSGGQAALQTSAVDDTGLFAIYVRPAADHWERYIQNPSLEPGEVNVIRLSPLSRTGAKSPGEQPYGWGQRIMKFDRISEDWNASGVKIGMIDSGCDGSHPILRHIVRGVDLTRDNDPESWKSDELGQGTHCAGVVAGAVVPSSAAVGCAPGSEVHVFKVVPGGYYSDLIEALDQCIERRLDVVQIGVCGEPFSELVAQKITEARLNGIACIAGAGNSGGPVQFPANVPGVLAVSAVGRLGEYPQNTRHAQRALPQFIAFAGIFATNFSCGGPQVAVCAPGVAVVSSVPGGGYAAWDGSLMAASHVTGFAALLLAHHPMLQSINYFGRTEQRAAVLFDLIRGAAIPYAQVDPGRVGAGLPDLQQVPALLPAQVFGTGPGTLLMPAVPPTQLHSAAGLWI